MILCGFVLGCVAIGFYSVRYGNSLKLLALHDSYGKECGGPDRRGFPYLYYGFSDKTKQLIFYNAFEQNILTKITKLLIMNILKNNFNLNILISSLNFSIH